MVPKAGFEPARVFPTTPSRWRVYRFHHFGTWVIDHLLGGAAGPGGAGWTGGAGAGAAGVAGADWGAAGFPAPCITEGACCRPIKVRPREVHIKIMATMAVSLARNGAAPVEPKTA